MQSLIHSSISSAQQLHVVTTITGQFGYRIFPLLQKVQFYNVAVGECQSHCTVVVVQSLSCVRLFVTPWTAARQAPLCPTVSWSQLKFMSIESVLLSNHLILSVPFFCLLSFLSSGSFPVSWLFMSDGQSTGASTSASVLPFRIDWFDLAVQGILKSLLQHHSSKASILWGLSLLHGNLNESKYLSVDERDGAGRKKNRSS